jgi:LysM repeat protein
MPTRIRLSLGLTALLALLMMSFQVTWAQDSAGTPEPPAEESGSSDSDIPLVHVVQEGETLFTIAEQYGTTIETLQILNSISDPSLLFVGQQLVIPGGGGEAVAALHTVRVGDTLLGIAADYNTTVDDLVSSNRLLNPYRLAAGRPLTVISLTGSAEPEEVTGDPYTVQTGDTLWSAPSITRGREIPVPSCSLEADRNVPGFTSPR